MTAANPKTDTGRWRQRRAGRAGAGAAGRVAFLLPLASLVFLAFMAFGLTRGLAAGGPHGGADDAAGTATMFPPPLDSYGDAGEKDLGAILAHRVRVQPFNLVATLLFFGAIVHTFLTHRFRHIAHRLEERHRARSQAAAAAGEIAPAGFRKICGSARVFHFLGEVEAVFGVWVIPLLLAMHFMLGRPAALRYMDRGVTYTEPVFVVVIMAMASTRPILRLAENTMRLLARLGGETPAAWWLVLLTVGPLLGSFITEPAAMTICASLLSRKFYAFKPGGPLAYGTLGLLFVTVSVGGTLTHFAAPPVLMVAAPWGWDLPFMLSNFGWRAAAGIAAAVACYYLVFREELARLGGDAGGARRADREAPIPTWVTALHLAFMIFAVVHAHNQPFLILGALFFLACVEVTQEFQSNFNLRAPVLVGFFLAGLVIHGRLQQWWIAPLLGRLGEVPLMLGATFLTAFNDNAAITYLCSLVPTFTDGMKYAAVAGAVTGGGLTVIANAPNPAGQSILNQHFEDGVGAVGLFLGATVPTIIVGCCFMLL